MYFNWEIANRKQYEAIKHDYIFALITLSAKRTNEIWDTFQKMDYLLTLADVGQTIRSSITKGIPRYLFVETLFLPHLYGHKINYLRVCK